MQYAYDSTAKRGKKQQSEKQGAYAKTFGIKTQWRGRNQNIEEQKENDG